MRLFIIASLIWFCQGAYAEKYEYRDNILYMTPEQDTLQQMVYRFDNGNIYRGVFEYDSTRIVVAFDSTASAEGKTDFVIVKKGPVRNSMFLLKLEKTKDASFHFNKKNGKVIFDRPDGIYSFNLVKDGNLVQSEKPVVELVKACAGCNRPEWVDEKKYKYKKTVDDNEVEYTDQIEVE